MEDRASKRRAWVKNVVIIFLVVMLFLTFFSNTIMNISLPEVSAQYAQYGSITSSIRATGSVSAVSTYRVYIEESRVIESIAVRTGDKVNKGDLLFTLEKSESGELKTAMDELESAKEILENLEREYEKYLINQSPEYSDSYANLKKALDDYNEAVAAAADIESLTVAYKSALSVKEAADESVKLIQNDLNKITGTDLVYDNIENQLKEARNILSTLQIQKDNAERNLESAKNTVAAYNSNFTTVEDSLNAVKARQSRLEAVKDRYRSLDDMNAKFRTAEEELDLLKKTWDDAKLALENYDASNSASETQTPGAGSDSVPAVSERDQLLAAVATAEASYYSKLADVNTQRLTITRAKEDLAIDGYYYIDETSTSSLVAELKQLAYSLQAAENAYENSTAMKTQAQANLDNAQSIYDEVSKEYTVAEEKVKLLENSQSSSLLNAELKEAQNVLRDAEKVLAEAEEKLNKAESAEKNIEQLKETYDTLKKNYDKNALLEDYTDADKQKEIAKQKEAVKAKEETVEKLKEKESGSTEVYSKVNGTIASIDCYAGQSVTRDTILCNVEITDQGYTVDVTVTADQARRLKIGDVATVENNWYTNAEATITAIKTDVNNPASSRIVTLLVTGNITAGESMTFSLGERSTSYQTTVPNSAIYEDNNGKFVLSVEVKNSPLGTRYIARRVDVEVITSDATSSAVSGLYGSEFVITSSTKPLSDGQQVKLVET